MVDKPDHRRSVLEDLGYELGDFDLWKGWLILEESSAESVILRCLIPWFTPSLNGVLRTIAARGIAKVEPKFEDFDRLFLFTHLEAVYHNRAWVAVDGDEPGCEAMSNLRSRYKTWDPNQFITLKEEDFERYYPPRFTGDADAALAIADKQKKREAKRELLDKVLTWAKEHEDEAQAEFATSAKEIIEFLRTIEAKLA